MPNRKKYGKDVVMIGVWVSRPYRTAVQLAAGVVGYRTVKAMLLEQTDRVIRRAQAKGYPIHVEEEES